MCSLVSSSPVLHHWQTGVEQSFALYILLSGLTAPVSTLAKSLLCVSVSLCFLGT